VAGTASPKRSLSSPPRRSSRAGSESAKGGRYRTRGAQTRGSPPRPHRLRKMREAHAKVEDKHRTMSTPGNPSRSSDFALE